MNYTKYAAAALMAGSTGLGTAHATENGGGAKAGRSEEHTSELQSLMRISYAVFCLKKKTQEDTKTHKIAAVMPVTHPTTTQHTYLELSHTLFYTHIQLT